MFMEGEVFCTLSAVSRLRHRDRHAAAADGGTGLELSSFVRPDHEPGSPAAMANENKSTVNHRRFPRC